MVWAVFVAENRRVVFKKNAERLDELLKEIEKYEDGKHDILIFYDPKADRIDGLSITIS